MSLVPVQSQRSASLSATLGLGVALYLVGVFLFALNDAIGKWLVADYGVGQLMLIRSVGSAVVLAPMALALKPALRAVENPRLQLLRVIAMATDTFAFYWATRYMPLADVMTFYMASPLIVTALSAPLLGEKVERFRWIAVLIGFAGVMIALRPTPQLFSWASPLALFGATMFALGQALTRKLRRSHWLQLTVWQFAGAGLIGAATIPFAWTTPNAFDLGLRRDRVDAVLHPDHSRAGAGARGGARALAIFGDPVGGADGLDRLARRADPSHHRRQRGHHRRRPLSSGAVAKGRMNGPSISAKDGRRPKDPSMPGLEPIPYPDAKIRSILERVRTIAMVGASPNWNRPSYFVMKYLQGKGYRVVPVNPAIAGETLLGETVYAALGDIPDTIDMVDMFRASSEAPGVVAEAIAIGAKVLWMQLGVRNDEAAKVAQAAGIEVIMNRCPKIEFGRLGGELSWSGVNSGIIRNALRRRRCRAG